MSEHDTDSLAQDKEFRNLLLQERQKASSTLDKALLTLSTGALGLSIIFVHNIVGNNEMRSPALLMCAWMFWMSGLIINLLSLYTSPFAFGKAVKQLDSGDWEREHLGGCWDIMTHICNIFGLIGFAVGCIMMLFFAWHNMR